MRRGLALILVVGVLAVLAVLGSAFAVLSRLERRAAAQRVYATKAVLLARSGIEDAQARLDLGQDADASSGRYRGEDWDGDGTLSTYECAQQVFHPTGPGTPADLENCPLALALRPSFWVSDKDPVVPKPAVKTVEGRERAYSGVLSGGGHYVTKVIPQAGICVNGGDPSSPVTATTDYNLLLRRMLGTLAKAIDEEQGGIDGSPVSEADGWALVSNRPSTGWRSWKQVRDLALGGGQAKLDALRPYLTLRSWVDRKVTRCDLDPTILAILEGASGGLKPGPWRDWILWHKAYPSLSLQHEPDFERIPRDPAGKVVGRSPVDFSWARKRRPVLLALLGNLKGVYLDQREDYPDSGGLFGDYIQGLLPQAGWAYVTRLPLTWSATDDCHLAAAKILASTKQVRTWVQWNALCETLTGLSGNPSPNLFWNLSQGQQAQKDLLKAAFNPNSDLNKFNPNPGSWRVVDKSDVLDYSTEFSLEPAFDHEVESLGRVLDPNGRILAQRTLRAVLSGPSQARLTTQKEFVCEDLGALDTAGDETDLRKPGFVRAGAPEFITQSWGVGKTWGHRLDQRAAYPSTWMDGDDVNANGLCMGLGLQTYPEPWVDDQTGAGLSIHAADYDGSLQLATKDTQTVSFYGVASPPKDMKMLAGYTTGLDLDLADGWPANSDGKKNLPDAVQVTTAELTNGLLHETKPNTLLPDGCYADYGTTPAYYDKGSANGFHGLISFWIKPNFLKCVGTTRSSHRFLYWSNCFNPFQFHQQAFIAGFLDGYGSSGIGVTTKVQWGLHLWFKSNHRVDETGLLPEHGFYNPTSMTFPSPLPMVSHRWHLVTLYYDFAGANGNACGETVFDDGSPTSTKLASNDMYLPPSPTNDSTAASDITTDDGDGPHRICLGGRADRKKDMYPATDAKEYYTGAASTIDEFAIYDFGQTEANAAILGMSRWRSGRYYRGYVYTDLSAAVVADQAPAWFSAPIRLQGARLEKVSWTWVRPADAELSTDYAEVELVKTDGSGYLDASSRSTRGPGWTRDLQSWKVGKKIDRLFRAHVVFRRVTQVGSTIPILDSPVFDDLTFTYRMGQQPRFSDWGGDGG